MQAISQTLPSEPTQSVLWVIFDHAWGRLGNSRLLTVWEVVIWSAFAAHVGFDIFGFYSPDIDSRISEDMFWVAVLLSPILIGPWIYRVSSAGGVGDDALRIVPVTPRTIVGARISAVLYMWARMIGPLVMICIYLFFLSGKVSEFIVSLRHNGDSSIENLVMIALILVAGVDYFLMPFTWAAYIGARATRFGAGFFLLYYLVLIFLAGLTCMPPGCEIILQCLHSPLYSSETYFKAAFAFASLLGALLTFLFFMLACREWRARRS